MQKKTVSPTEFFGGNEEILRAQSKNMTSVSSGNKNMAKNVDDLEIVQKVTPEPEFREIVVIEQTAKGPVKHIFKGDIKIVGTLVKSETVGEVTVDDDEEGHKFKKPTASGKPGGVEGGIDIYSDKIIAPPIREMEIQKGLLKKFESEKTFYEDEDFINWRIQELKNKRREIMEVRINPSVMGKDVRIEN